MKLLRSIMFPLLAGVAAACITDPGPIGTSGGSTGNFSITIAEFGIGPTNGAATFQLDQEGDVPTLTLSFIDSLGITIALSGPGTPVVGEDREIGVGEGLLGGLLIRRTSQGTMVYQLTGGSMHVGGSSATRLVGQIEFTAVQTEGTAVGSIIHGSGNFNASGGNALP